MGIESPNMEDIESVSKGLNTDVHIQAVNNIKRWGGNAGGTFVIGLPDQTEDQILEFPAYAKRDRSYEHRLSASQRLFLELNSMTI